MNAMKKLSVFSSKRYRTIIFAITFFILFDVSVLGLNIFIGSEISKDAAAINLAGQMRMMSQRTVKSLYEIDLALENNSSLERPLMELRQSYLSFSKNLALFKKGGVTRNSESEQVYMELLDDEVSIRILNQIDSLWLPYRNLLNPLAYLAEVRADNALIFKQLGDAINYGSANNLTLLRLSTELVDNIERKTESKIFRLKLAQLIGVGLALANFVLILFHFIGHLNKNDKELERSKKQTEEILNTVQEGLLLIDKDYIISNQYSRFIELVFTDVEIAGGNIFDLLSDRLTGSDISIARKYISLLFDKNILADLTSDLNPLSRVVLHSMGADGTSSKRIFSFNFNQVKGEDGAIVHLLVTMRDVTELVELEAKVEEAKSQSDEQIQVIKNILATDPDQFSRYLTNTQNTLLKVNAILEKPVRNYDGYRQQLEDIFIEVHRMKGESSLNKMYEISKLCHEMESLIQRLKTDHSLDGNDFIPLTIKLNEMMKRVETYNSVIAHLSQYNSSKGHEAASCSKIIDKKEIFEYAENLALNEGKKINFSYNELGDPIPSMFQAPLSDIIIQLLKNSVVHGIEPSDKRVSFGKNPKGRIVINTLAKEEQVILSIRDDGAGVDLESLRDKAHQLGGWEKEQVDGWTGSKLLETIFLSGVSTAPIVTENAGRGVGMGLIREIVKQHFGKIKVATIPGKSTSILIKIPLRTGLVSEDADHQNRNVGVRSGAESAEFVRVTKIEESPLLAAPA